MAEWSGDRRGSWEDKVLWQLDQIRQVLFYIIIGAVVLAMLALIAAAASS